MSLTKDVEVLCLLGPISPRPRNQSWEGTGTSTAPVPGMLVIARCILVAGVYSDRPMHSTTSMSPLPLSVTILAAAHGSAQPPLTRHHRLDGLIPPDQTPKPRSDVDCVPPEVRRIFVAPRPRRRPVRCESLPEAARWAAPAARLQPSRKRSARLPSLDRHSGPGDRSRHESVAGGLDFFQTVRIGNLLEIFNEELQVCDDLLRWISIAV